MKKLLVLGLTSLFACNTQLFSMESKHEITEEKDHSQSDISFIKDAEYIEYDKEHFLSDDVRYIVRSFPESTWFWGEIKELKKINPEVFENIDYLIYYLLGAAKQIKKENSKWLSIKGWINTFSDYMHKSTESDIRIKRNIFFPHCSFHEALDVFIETFSLSSSNEIEINGYKIKKEIMKKFFKCEMCSVIDKSHVHKYTDEEKYFFYNNKK